VETEADNLVQELSRDLGLAYELQDWGIINADPTRVREFINYFNKQALASTQRLEMGELIIASMNEAMLENSVDRETLQDFEAFIRNNEVELELKIQYWARLKCKDEFPVSPLIQLMFPP
jgi:hypothetical protein